MRFVDQFMHYWMRSLAATLPCSDMLSPAALFAPHLCTETNLFCIGIFRLACYSMHCNRTADTGTESEHTYRNDDRKLQPQLTRHRKQHAQIRILSSYRHGFTNGQPYWLRTMDCMRRCRDVTRPRSSHTACQHSSRHLSFTRAWHCHSE